MIEKRIPARFEVKVGIHGVGVFTKVDIKKGSVLFKLRGCIITQPTRTSVQLGKNRHVENVLAGHLNHNCHPNAKVNRKMHYFVSTRDIKKGEEITFNYNDNEEKMAAPFKCECCGRMIKGKSFPLTEKKTDVATVD